MRASTTQISSIHLLTGALAKSDSEDSGRHPLGQGSRPGFTRL